MNALVLEKLKRKRSQSLSIVMVLLISISFAIMSLVLITSLQRTNQERREDLYGEWGYRVTDAGKTFEKKMAELEDIDYYGTMKVLGHIQEIYGFGTIDENMKRAGRFSLAEGEWAEGENEVVLTEDCLKSLGCEKELGQDVVLRIELTNADGEVFVAEKSFVLCGILEGYADLWINGTGERYAGALVTEQAVETICSEIGISCESRAQYFLVLNREVMTESEKMESLDKEIFRFAAEMRETSGIQPVFEKNRPLFLGGLEQLESDLYIKLIALVCFGAILSTYFLRIQEEIHYCGVLRSIGITTLQLVKLSALECVYVLLPAVCLGIPLGVGLTWGGMKLFLQTEIKDFCLEIPYESILQLIFLWIILTLLVRGMITFLALRVSLNGKIQLPVAGKKIFAQVKNIFIIIVLALGVYMVLNGIIGRREAMLDMEKYEAMPHYEISADTINEDGELLPLSVKDEDIRLIRNMKEVDGTLSYSYADIGIFIESLPDRTAQMVIVNAEELEQWNEVLGMTAEEQEAFREGEMGIMCFPSDEIELSHLSRDQIYLLPGETLENRIYPEVHGPVTLTFYNEDHEIVAKKTLSVKVEYLSYESDYAFQGVELHSAYTILCSDQMIEELLHQSQEDLVWTPPYREDDPDGHKWSTISYGGGQGVGYRYVQVWANPLADFERLDIKLAEFCKAQGYKLENNRAENLALVQEQLQKVIRIFAVGGCVGLLSVLLYIGIASLEAQTQRQYYRQLWMLGLSKRGIFRREVGRTAVHAILAIVSGIGFFFYEKLKLMISQVQYMSAMEESAEPFEFGYSQAWERLIEDWRYYEIHLSSVVYVGIGALAFILLLSILIKRRLWKGDMTR